MNKTHQHYELKFTVMLERKPGESRAAFYERQADAMRAGFTLGDPLEIHELAIAEQWPAP